MSSKAITSSKESTFHGVLHNKVRGNLILSESGLSFQQEAVHINGATDEVDKNTGNNGVIALQLPWINIVKHQVSPANHPKSLLKIIQRDSCNNAAPDKTSSHTFQFLTRNGLESARREISSRLAKLKSDDSTTAIGRKRPRDEKSSDADDKDDANDSKLKRQSSPPSSTYITHDPVALLATRSSLLASDPALRSQHRLLVVQNGTLSEDDFWETHSRLVADEYARISGRVCGGMSSSIKSSLDLGLASSGVGGGRSGGAGAGVIHLGVEEMRQIFLMYPAVHRAYEEKVPLELSEEQFWRKYLESEYFHRDRGRVGLHIGRVNELEKMEMERMVGKKGMGDKIGGSKGPQGTAENGDRNTAKKEDKKDAVAAKDRVAGDEARLAAAAGTDDIFSRFDQGNRQQSLQLGTKLAIGQFDLASTAETERGERYLQGMDLHPSYTTDGQDSRGARVIEKYNRHWAIVLHPNESTGGADLSTIASKTIQKISHDVANTVDCDAKAIGGVDREMSALVGFANATENHADHSRGIGEDDADCMELILHNLGGYSGKYSSVNSSKGDNKGSTGGAPANDSDLAMKCTKYLAAKLQETTEPLIRDQSTGKVKGFEAATVLKRAFPDPKIGRGLLEALSKKMAADSQTEADAQRLADSLPEEFRTKLATYFRRSTELLRHFFGLRSVLSDDSDDSGGIGASESQRNRLTSIIKGMEKVHGEMYELTRNLPLVEAKMFKPIMDQLDWAFKLHREDSSKGGRGGFVPVARGGFVKV
ncbi:hypothetical protein ACHAW6_002939 [Cyclotella cf. meneghiniana]